MHFWAKLTTQLNNRCIVLGADSLKISIDYFKTIGPFDYIQSQQTDDYID